jgi:hypothetical protein
MPVIKMKDMYLSYRESDDRESDDRESDDSEYDDKD